MGYFEFQREMQTCGQCGWTGAGREARDVAESIEVIAHHCPRCDAKLGTSVSPTRSAPAEVRKARASIRTAPKHPVAAARRRGNVVSIAAAKPDVTLVRELSRKLTGMLETFSEEVFTTAVNVAMSGAWKEWNDEQPTGTVQEISLKTLMETDDPTVKALAQLHLQVRQCIETLRPRRAG